MNDPAMNCIQQKQNINVEEQLEVMQDTANALWLASKRNNSWSQIDVDPHIEGSGRKSVDQKQVERNLPCVLFVAESNPQVDVINFWDTDFSGSSSRNFRVGSALKSQRQPRLLQDRPLHFSRYSRAHHRR